MDASLTFLGTILSCLLHNLHLKRLNLCWALQLIIPVGTLETIADSLLMIAVPFKFNLCLHGLLLILDFLNDLLVAHGHFKATKHELFERLVLHITIQQWVLSIMASRSDQRSSLLVLNFLSVSMDKSTTCWPFVHGDFVWVAHFTIDTLL